MQNVRSKSTTAGASFGASYAVGAAGPAAVPGVAPQLRVVPGRMLLFVLLLATVASLMVPRLASAASPGGEEDGVHVVAAGETLWDVAQDNAANEDLRSYVDALRRVNRLASPVIFPGQELLLP